MSFLNVYHDHDPDQPLLTTHDGERIAAELAAHGIRFERWATKADLAPDADPEVVLAAYAEEIERLKADNGFATADVIGLTPEHPDREALRAKFLDEHRHSEDEVRFFVRGEGVFYLHLDSRVYAVGCAQGDLMSVPAGTPHWFDMGPAPHFTAIRLFTNPEGWVANFTGAGIAARFPRFEALPTGGGESAESAPGSLA
ncbi:acireductone dioxygenase apoprotein [Onishia taeanensis]|uniref:Acireductone dioxygenase n=1 Tax=Onishia taeanensis TaxID=284577 RepID=A0A1G7PBJ0_9GAMM|nr:cupin domain-containing protein [Halomonas taeanensis]SDF83653.1 acireductone dioxygenase apoprotein [Halomonas taeanensis]